MTIYPENLYKVLLAKRSASPEKSWTAKLMQGGVTAISKKIAEEAAELSLAARELEIAETQTQHISKKQLYDQTIHEAADLLYHYLVLLAYLDIPPHAVHAVLETRSHTSGVEEKRTRKHK